MGKDLQLIRFFFHLQFGQFLHIWKEKCFQNEIIKILPKEEYSLQENIFQSYFKKIFTNRSLVSTLGSTHKKSMFPYCIKHQILKEFPLVLSSKSHYWKQAGTIRQQWEISLWCRPKLSNKYKQDIGRTLRINALVEPSPGIDGFAQISCSRLCLVPKINIENKSKLRPGCWHCWWGHLEVPSLGWSGPGEEHLHLARTSDPSCSLWLRRVTWTSRLGKGWSLHSCTWSELTCD